MPKIKNLKLWGMMIFMTMYLISHHSYAIRITYFFRDTKVERKVSKLYKNFHELSEFYKFFYPFFVINGIVLNCKFRKSSSSYSTIMELILFLDYQ